MIEFRIDTNGTRVDGTIEASRRRTPGEVSAGQTVRVTDIADMKRYNATVLRVTERAVELRIDWNSQMLPLDMIDSLASRYFDDVPTPRLVRVLPTSGAGKQQESRQRLGRGLAGHGI